MPPPLGESCMSHEPGPCDRSSAVRPQQPRSPFDEPSKISQKRAVSRVSQQSLTGYRALQCFVVCNFLSFHPPLFPSIPPPPPRQEPPKSSRCLPVPFEP